MDSIVETKTTPSSGQARDSRSPGGPLGLWYTAVPTEAPVDVRGTILIYETEHGFVTLGATRGRPVLLIQDYAQAADQPGQGPARFTWKCSKGRELQFPMLAVGSGAYSGLLAAPDPWRVVSYFHDRDTVMILRVEGHAPFALELPPLTTQVFIEFLAENNC